MTKAIWNSTFTRRWHSNPGLMHTFDTVGWHSHRIAVMILHYFPDASRALLIEALQHDLGEIEVGDVSADAKRKHPNLARVIGIVEHKKRVEIGIPQLPTLDVDDWTILRFFDMLDALLWMRMYRPELEKQKDWVGMIRDMMMLADEFPGLGEVVRDHDLT